MSRPISAMTTIVLCMAVCKYASASIVSITAGNTVVGDHGSNLITNGSFETRESGGPNITTDVNWSGAEGSHLALTQVAGGGYVYPIPGWGQHSNDGAYGVWGPGAARGGASCTDGVACVYLGNFLTTPSVQPVFGTNGIVTFPSVPVFTNSRAETAGPTTLFQMLTGLIVGDEYLLDFWASGEDNTTSRQLPGVFGLNIGSDSVFLTAPSQMSVFHSASIRYDIRFIATTANETISFVNWGHLGTPSTPQSTELILDDVIVNHVPEPSSIILATIALLGAGSVSRKKRSNSSN